MYWLNVDYSTSLWKLHLESCRYCKPVETDKKGVNLFKEHGSWLSFNTFPEAETYFKESSVEPRIWQPCKTCHPEKGKN